MKKVVNLCIIGLSTILLTSLPSEGIRADWSWQEVMESVANVGETLTEAVGQFQNNVVCPPGNEYVWCRLYDVEETLEEIEARKDYNRAQTDLSLAKKEKSNAETTAEQTKEEVTSLEQKIRTNQEKLELAKKRLETQEAAAKVKETEFKAAFESAEKAARKYEEATQKGDAYRAQKAAEKAQGAQQNAKKEERGILEEKGLIEEKLSNCALEVDSATLNKEGEILLKNKDYFEAIEKFECALSNGPANQLKALIAYNLGQAYQKDALAVALGKREVTLEVNLFYKEILKGKAMDNSLEVALACYSYALSLEPEGALKNAILGAKAGFLPEVNAANPLLDSPESGKKEAVLSNVKAPSKT